MLINDDDDDDDDDDDSSLLLGLRLASIVSWLAITNTNTNTNTDDDAEEDDDNAHDHDIDICTNIYSPVLALFNSCKSSANIKPLFVFQRTLLTVIGTLVLEGRVKDTTTFIIALGYPIAFNKSSTTNTDDITGISMHLLTVVLSHYLSLVPRIIFTLCTNTATSTSTNKAATKKRRITDDDDESDDAIAMVGIPCLSDDQRLRLAAAIVGIITNNDGDNDEQLQKIETALTSEVLSTGSKLSARALPMFPLTDTSKATITASLRSGISAKLISHDVQKLLQQRVK